ncbi:hypothetical protein BGW41_000820 [Actinomortierella wolfii]|nr:hypothetical protein BGW41_000820 [Actinomortierella wolfii]
MSSLSESTQPINQSAHDDSTTHQIDDIQDDSTIYDDVPAEVMQAVENMLRDMDMDEDIHRAPSAFRILRPLSQLDLEDNGTSLSDSSTKAPNTSNGYMVNPKVDGTMDSEEEHDIGDDDAVAFGYIPLGQDEYVLCDSEDEDDREEEEGSDGQVERDVPQDANGGVDDDAGQGFADYLVSKDGKAIVPRIPTGVVIESQDMQDPIPEADLQTIQAIMRSFVLPPSSVPDWAKAIPEERWLPRISAQLSTETQDQNSK